MCPVAQSCAGHCAGRRVGVEDLRVGIRGGVERAELPIEVADLTPRQRAGHVRRGHRGELGQDVRRLLQTRVVRFGSNHLPQGVAVGKPRLHGQIRRTVRADKLDEITAGVGVAEAAHRGATGHQLRGIRQFMRWKTLKN